MGWSNPQVWRGSLLQDNVSLPLAGNGNASLGPWDVTSFQSVYLQVSVATGNGANIRLYQNDAQGNNLAYKQWDVTAWTSLQVVVPLLGDQILLFIRNLNAGPVRLTVTVAPTNTGSGRISYPTAQNICATPGFVTFPPNNIQWFQLPWIQPGPATVYFNPDGAASVFTCNVNTVDATNTDALQLFGIFKPGGAPTFQQLIIPDTPIQLKVQNTDAVNTYHCSALLIPGGGA